MGVSIIDIRTAPSGRWDKTWRECPYATYFHSREWSEIWSRFTEGRVSPSPVELEFSDGRSAIVPLSRRRRFAGLLDEYFLSPAGTFGGWISTDEMTEDHARLMVNHLIKEYRNLTWRVSPYHAYREIHEAPLVADTTLALRLVDGFDKVHSRWSKGHKAAAKQAAKYGVIVKPASSPEQWKSYYEVYQDAIRRWGENVTSSYRWKLFETMCECNSPFIKLWLAVYNDIVVAGALCLYSAKHVAYWHGAALQEFFKVRPANLLMYEAIKDACDNGYEWFDFNPSGGQKGPEAFKRSFGVVELPAPIIYKVAAPNTLARKVLRAARTGRQTKS